MNKKAVNVAIFLMVVSVTILVSQAAVAPYNKSGALSVKTVSSRAYANGSRRIKSPNPPDYHRSDSIAPRKFRRVAELIRVSTRYKVTLTATVTSTLRPS